MDTSSSEGEDKKDFFLPDYPSDELTSSDSSDNVPEDASAENLSMAGRKITRVNAQFLQDHVCPQNISDHINNQRTAHSFIELFLDADFGRLLCRQTNRNYSHANEGMIPTKKCLAIKQYIRDKPVRWGTKGFLLCEAKTGYILDADIYTGRVKDATGSSLDPQAVLFAVSWRTHRLPTRTTCC